MKIVGIVLIILALLVVSVGCMRRADDEEAIQVESQQTHYSEVQPVPRFDHSIPRDVLLQIYNVVTTEARSTYTVIQSITGEVVFHGASVGYGIPADTQLTNPVQKKGDTVIEQAEPNGLFSSKNTDGTWILFVEEGGVIAPIYTEQKVTTYPFIVARDASGAWVRTDDAPPSFTVEINK